MLPCHIVQDLLPSYIEHLTAPETDTAVRDHLDNCPDCRAAQAAMATDLALEKAPPPRLNFLKKLRRQQIIGAVLSVIVTLLCLYGLYSMEYNIDLTNTAGVEAVINERLQHVGSMDRRFAGAGADVLQSVPVKNRVFVLYRIGGQDEHLGHGVAHFEKGIFGKYRLRSCGYTNWKLMEYNTLKIGRQNYLLLSGVNDPLGAASFRIFADYHPAAYEGEEIVDITQEAPVYEGETAAEILTLVPITAEQARHAYWPTAAVYYDENGTALDSRALASAYGYDGGAGGSSCGSGYAPSTMYVYCLIALLLGIIFVRYFIKP